MKQGARWGQERTGALAVAVDAKRDVFPNLFEVRGQKIPLTTVLLLTKNDKVSVAKR